MFDLRKLKGGRRKKKSRCVGRKKRNCRTKHCKWIKNKKKSHCRARQNLTVKRKRRKLRTKTRRKSR